MRGLVASATTVPTAVRVGTAPLTVVGASLGRSDPVTVHSLLRCDRDRNTARPGARFGGSNQPRAACTAAFIFAIPAWATLAGLFILMS